MAAENFAKSLKLVLLNEGGNDDDPSDHGGRTSRGITQNEYNAYCHIHGLPSGDVWKAPQDVIADIYHESYWEPYCDWMPTPIDYLFFDMAVNAGPYRATKLLQRALGVDADGRIGPITKAAIIKANPNVVNNNFAKAKSDFYRSIANGSQRKYLRGWLNRTNDVQTAAHQMMPTVQTA